MKLFESNKTGFALHVSIVLGMCRGMHMLSHTWYAKGWLDIPRKEGGRGLISIENCVELAIRGLKVHVYGSEERLIQAARGDKINGV